MPILSQHGKMNEEMEDEGKYIRVVNEITGKKEWRYSPEPPVCVRDQPGLEN